jgi:hypothetical protein
MVTTKQQILSAFESLPDNCSIAEAIDHLYLLQKIQKGLQDANDGKLMDHDEFFDELERDDEEVPSSLDRTGAH